MTHDDYDPRRRDNRRDVQTNELPRRGELLQHTTSSPHSASNMTCADRHVSAVLGPPLHGQRIRLVVEW